MDSKIKIKVEAEGKNRIEAEERIVKALTANTHKDGFRDPANQHVADVMLAVHSKLFDSMLEEIFKELESEDFSGNE